MKKVYEKDLWTDYKEVPTENDFWDIWQSLNKVSIESNDFKVLTKLIGKEFITEYYVSNDLLSQIISKSKNSRVKKLAQELKEKRNEE